MLEETRPTGNGRARGLVSSRESGRRVEAHTFAPGPAMRDLVECYWTTCWDLTGQPPHRVEVLADPCATLALEAGRSRVVGVSTRLFTRQLEGAGLIRAAKLRAGAARAFLAGPLARLTDRVVPLAEELPRLPAGLERAVLQPGDDAEGLEALEGWLAAVADRRSVPLAGLAARLMEQVELDPELASAAELAARARLSLRQLQKLFKDQVGITPRWALRRRRLQEAALRLERGKGPTLAELAAELGYADHAHLTRDFRAATGRTPSSFARDARR